MAATINNQQVHQQFDHVAGSVLGVIGMVGGWVLGFITITEAGEVLLWATLGAIAGWATTQILNKFFKPAFDKFLDQFKSKKKKSNGSKS